MSDENPNLFRRLRRAWRVGVWGWYENFASEGQWVDQEWRAPKINFDSHMRSVIWRVVDEPDDDHGMSLKRLRSQDPARARPQLHEVLASILRSGQRGDWSNATALWGLYNLLEVLTPVATAESIPLVFGLLDHPDDDVQEYARRALPIMAIAECVEPLSKLLRTATDDECKKIVSGFHMSLKSPAGKSEFFKAMFTPLLEQLDRPETDSDLPSVLASIDPQRSIDAFLIPSRWTPRYAHLDDVLTAMHEHARLIPNEKLRELHQSLKGESQNLEGRALARAQHTYGSLVEVMALTRHPDAPQAISELLKGGRSAYNAGAEALRCWHGVKDPRAFIRTLLEHPGYDSVSEVQRNYIAASLVTSAIYFDGIDLLLHNSTGEYFADAVIGLEAVGAEKRLAILQEVAAMFGPKGIPKDHRERQGVWGRLTPEQNDRIAKLSSRYMDLEEPMHAMLDLYVAKHADQFGGRLD